MKLCELMSKRVVCVNEGRELGFISDAILSVSLQIQFIIVTQPKRGMARFCPWLFVAKSEKISVEKIVNIGADVILVKKDR